MTQRSFSELVLHHPRLHVDDTLDTAVRIVYDSDEPALPVVDERERYAGIFGEREFMKRSFPATSNSCAMPPSWTARSTRRSSDAPAVASIQSGAI